MEPRDSVDAHVERWQAVLRELDPVVEGAVTRMQVLVKHLRRTKEKALVAHGLHEFEYATLHALVARSGRAAPSDLATDLRMSPAAVTGRLDTLERRGYVRRRPSAADRRRVDVELTAEGRAVWRGAFDDVGREEHRLLGALGEDERAVLSDLLRRVLSPAEG